MDSQFRLTLDQASSVAPRIDLLYYFLCAISAFFTVLIFALVAFFAIKYRRRSPDERPRPTIESLRLELFYTIVPFFILMFIFAWGARDFFFIYGKPTDPLEIHVIGKQWMWKIQHPDGKREINELHVPLNRDVQLTMASQDVIHSFFIPAFRIKTDVLPNRYTRMSFRPTKVGRYHLFCAEYCGTEHSRMVGTVVVMEPEQYESWLGGTRPEDSPVASGEKLFTQLGCKVCHGITAPPMAGLYGSERRYRRYGVGEVQTVVADEDYLRESILDSTSKVVENYNAIMPSYRTPDFTEEQLMQLIAYIRSLKNAEEAKSGEVRVAPEHRQYEIQGDGR